MTSLEPPDWRAMVLMVVVAPVPTPVLVILDIWNSKLSSLTCDLLAV